MMAPATKPAANNDDPEPPSRKRAASARAGGVVGAHSGIKSTPALSNVALSPALSSGGRSGRINPSNPARFASDTNRSTP